MTLPGLPSQAAAIAHPRGPAMPILVRGPESRWPGAFSRAHAKPGRLPPPPSDIWLRRSRRPHARHQGRRATPLPKPPSSSAATAACPGSSKGHFPALEQGAAKDALTIHAGHLAGLQETGLGDLYAGYGNRLSAVVRSIPPGRTRLCSRPACLVWIRRGGRVRVWAQPGRSNRLTPFELSCYPT